MVKLNIVFLTITLAASFFLTSTVEAAFNASLVPESDRNIWCSDQSATCNNICLDSGNQPETNNCDPVTLDYKCVCSNGLEPNSTRYTQTIPYFQCTFEQRTCQSNCAPGNQACQDACNNKCGATAPGPTNTSGSKIPPSASPTSSSSNQASDTSTPSGNILTSKAIKLPSTVINASFVIFLTAIFVMFIRL